jgi:NAD(P) transhydrogenase subunit alpha
VPATASFLYAKNLVAFLQPLIDPASHELAINWDDEIVKATLLTRDGALTHPNFQAPADSVAENPPAAEGATAAEPAETPAKPKKARPAKDSTPAG